jgi:hypothetical protein
LAQRRFGVNCPLRDNTVAFVFLTLSDAALA